jgi:hypothetical protein
MFMARLEMVAEKQQEYHAHLIRDGNQECFKNLVLENMPVDSFFLLVDYWAKISIGKAGGTATCEGDSKGLSAHGSMFVYRNPTTAQRAAISLKLGGFDWEPFGLAPDEGGLSLLEEHINVYCDDAKQNNFHTKSMLDATVANFITARPWLNSGRKAFVQSDKASNYRDPTTEIDLPAVGTRCFSEAGMGKDEGDANGALNRGGMKRSRDEGAGVESAGDCLAIGESLKIPGQTHAVMKLQRANEDSGIKGRDTVSRSYHLWVVDKSTITFWEYLDEEASKMSIKATGRATGIGPGVTMAIAEFNKTQRTQQKQTGGALEFADGGGASLPNPKQRPSKEESAAAKVVMAERHAAKAAAAAEKAAAAQATAEAAYAHETAKCKDCGRKFLSGGGLASHRRNQFCPKFGEAAAKRRLMQHVPSMLVASDALAVQQRVARIASLRIVRVTLRAPVGGAAALGIALEQNTSGGPYLVSAVSGLAELSARIVAGYTVVGFDAGGGIVAPKSTGDLGGEIQAGSSVVVELRRPPPPIPDHGSARKNIRKQANFKMLETQRVWLEKNVYKNGIEIMRPKVAWEAMKAAFTNELRTDTSTPMWLEKAQISTWLADQHKTEKDRRKKANAEQPAKSDGGEAGNDERPAKKAKAASKALPAAAKPKVAPEAAPKAASTKPTASDATKQATKQSNRQSNKQGSKAGAPKRKANAGRGSNKKKKKTAPPCT